MIRRTRHQARLFSVLLIFILAVGVLSVFGTAARAAVVTSPSPPAGFPGAAAVASTGDSMVSMIESSARFEQLANGVQFKAEQYSSFGYSWGPTTTSVENVILWSANGDAYIDTQVVVSNDTIVSMDYTNTTQLGFEAGGSANWGGYQGQYCTYEIIGVCTSTGSVDEAYGNLQVPNNFAEHSALGSEETGACCALFQWVGVANASGGSSYLVQGGVDFICCHLPIPSEANSENLSLWTEFAKCSSCSSSATFIQPYSWMSGVGGTTIDTQIYPNANCGAGGDLWYIFWSYNGNNAAQSIECMRDLPTYGLYITEAPANNAYCTAGYYVNPNYYCQIPEFTYGTSGLSLTGNICDGSGCENLNINSNPITQYYISQGTQDTTTSNIPASGNSWTETWDSSLQ